MSIYLTGPDQPERDFIATLKSLGFRRPTPEDGMKTFGSRIVPRSTFCKGDVWVGILDTHAGIFGWGRGWRPFAEVLEEIEKGS